MSAFQCDSCFHKKVCMECPDIGGINEPCALYANVENCHSLQQLKAEIAAIATQMCSTPTTDVVAYWHEIYTKLRQLSAV
jgi:hypothetical protein